MTRPRLILHIGPHKTGTTFLQSRLLQHAALLRERGINYVQAGIGPQFGHHRLTAELRTTGPGPAWAAVAQEWAHHPCHIISSENFSRLPAPAIAQLAELLQGLDVDVCFLLRSPEALLYAAWQEHVKHGSVLSLPEFVAPHLAEPERSALLNPEVLLAPYLAAFPGRLRLFDYDAIRSSGHSLLHVLLDALLLGPAPTADNAVVNKSMRVERAEVLRAMNALAVGRCAPGEPPSHRRADGALYNTRQFLEVAKQAPTCLAALLAAQEGHLGELALSGSHTLGMARQDFVRRHAAACVGPWGLVPTADVPAPQPAGLPWLQSAWLLHPSVPAALAELAALTQQAEAQLNQAPHSPQATPAA